MHVLLVSTYELGRQPFGLASPAAWLQEIGADVRIVDVAKTPLDDASMTWAGVVAFYLPMHTATRLAVPLIRRVRSLRPDAIICAYGLYGPPNEDFLRSVGVQHVLGGEFEQDLVNIVHGAGDRTIRASNGTRKSVPRLVFRVPNRRDLPPLERYASLLLPGGERRVVGYTEASRGCKHLCRHCPVVAVYGGQFRIVPPDVVLADVRQQVETGARHITFGDPDFFNGIGHAVGVVQALAQAFPGLTYDVTIKIEHLIKHQRHLGTLRGTGCLFVTSAVESIDDRVLTILDKGHTRADFETALSLCRAAGLTLAPTFVAFHPWMVLDDYLELVDVIDDLDLVEQVAPIQLAIRLLIPAGSRLLELPEVRALVGRFDPARLVYPWRHPDPRVDSLQEEVTRFVGRGLNAPRRAVFAAIRAAACARTGRPLRGGDRAEVRQRVEIPYLNEPWYC